MAAGMGSRYGGLKRIDPVGPNGEIILDYSVYDAAKATVKVLSTCEKWYGVTYKEDRETVVAALKEKTEQGIYPSCLWSK